MAYKHKADELANARKWRDRNRAILQIRWIWYAMHRRCKDKRNTAYKNYGGRGITVCDRWNIFKNFYEDMGPRPVGMLLDRKDNDGNYEPRNCRWATRIESASNRRSCIYVQMNGETVTLKEACRKIGIKYRPVVKRIQYRGWNIERALSTPIGIGNTHAH